MNINKIPLLIKEIERNNIFIQINRNSIVNSLNNILKKFIKKRKRNIKNKANSNNSKVNIKKSKIYNITANNQENNQANKEANNQENNQANNEVNNEVNNQANNINNFFPFYKDNKNRKISINSKIALQTNLGSFSDITLTNNRNLIKFGKFVNQSALIINFKNELYSFFYNLFLYKQSNSLFPKLKEFGLFLNLNKFRTYGVYEKYNYDLFSLIFKQKINRKIEEYLKKMDFINNLMQQIMEAIRIIHNNGLIHNDLKPENILVEEIHNNGLIHNDLKPENILVEETSNYRYLICDFGTMCPNGTISNNLYGSALYLPGIKLEQYFSCIRTRRKTEIINHYANDYFALAYMFYIFINIFFRITVSNAIDSLFHINTNEKTGINKKILNWITNYISTIDKIKKHLDSIKTSILILFYNEDIVDRKIIENITENIKATFSYRKFVLGVELIKSLFEANNPNDLINGELLARQKIDEYLSFINT